MDRQLSRQDLEGIAPVNRDHDDPRYNVADVEALAERVHGSAPATEEPAEQPAAGPSALEAAAGAVADDEDEELGDEDSDESTTEEDSDDNDEESEDEDAEGEDADGEDDVGANGSDANDAESEPDEMVFTTSYGGTHPGFADVDFPSPTESDLEEFRREHPGIDDDLDAALEGYAGDYYDDPNIFDDMSDGEAEYTRQ